MNRIVVLLTTLVLLAARPVPDQENWSETDAVTQECLGVSVASAGDVNGDGYDDLLIAASSIQRAPSANTVRLFSGGPGGSSPEPSWTVTWTYTNNTPGNCRVAGAGDVDGDGFSDFLVLLQQYPMADGSRVNSVLLYHGGPGGPPQTPGEVLTPTAGTYLGDAVCRAGDVDHDGFDDFLVGAPNYSVDLALQGGAYLFRGHPRGVPMAEPWFWCSGRTNAMAGFSLSTAGDVNGDGYGDIVVGAPSFAGGQTQEGALYVFHGSAAGLPAAPSLRIESNRIGAELGMDVAAAGDVNGDGFDDVVAGAPSLHSPTVAPGAVFVYAGSGSGLVVAEPWAAFGSESVTYLGMYVQGVGDVNADGYDDIAASSLPSQSSSPSGTNPAVLVFHGSASGLPETPAELFEGERSSGFGRALCSPFDANGDGAADLTIGEPFYDITTNPRTTDSGRVRSWWGRGPIPARPSLPRQLRADRVTPIPRDGDCPDPEFTASAVVSGSDGASLQLQVELKPAGVEFDGAAADLRTSGAGSPAMRLDFSVEGLSAGQSYRWRARTLSSRGTASAWVRPWRREDPGMPDLRTPANDAPEVSSLAQRSMSSGLAAGPGAPAADDGPVALSARVDDANGHNVRFEVEVRPEGADFGGSPTASVSGARSGSDVTLLVTLPPGTYRWRGRAIDEPWGAESAWIEDAGARFSVIANGSMNPSACAGGPGRAGIPVWILAFLGAAFRRPRA